jgi:hypothetical protein
MKGIVGTARAVTLAIAACLASTSLSDAVVIDFEGLPFTPVVAGTIPAIPASVLIDNFKADGVIFGKSGVSAGVAVVRDSFAPSSGLNTVAGLDAAGNIPGGVGATVGDIFFSFVVPGTSTPASTDLASFTIGDGGGDLDIFQIRTFDLADSLINTQDVSGSSRFPVTISVPGIHRVEVDFTGDFGYSLDDLSFTAPGGASVPEPGTLLLLGAGLAGRYPETAPPFVSVWSADSVRWRRSPGAVGTARRIAIIDVRE